MADGRYADVLGLHMYYEVHGDGEPLILLHGGSDTIETSYSQLLPLLAESRQAIPVELQAHGHTADIDGPLSYEVLADHVAALIDHLGLPQADVMGFSMGGGVAIQTAIRHPGRVRRLIVGSAAVRSDGWFAEILDGIKTTKPEDMVGSPWHDAYLRVASRPEDSSRSFARAQEVVSGKAYDWSSDFAALEMPVMIFGGDADSVKISHFVEMFGLLGGGKADGMVGGMPRVLLEILPATNHLDVTSRTTLLVPAISAFLDAIEEAG